MATILGYPTHSSYVLEVNIFYLFAYFIQIFIVTIKALTRRGSVKQGIAICVKIATIYMYRNCELCGVTISTRSITGTVFLQGLTCVQMP